MMRAYDYFYGYRMMNRIGFGGLFFHFLMMILILVGIVLLVRYLLHGNRRMGAFKHPFLSEPTALEIAQKRYAKGEISKEEFDTIKAALKD